MSILHPQHLNFLCFPLHRSLEAVLAQSVVVKIEHPEIRGNNAAILAELKWLFGVVNTEVVDPIPHHFRGCQAKFGCKFDFIRSFPFKKFFEHLFHHFFHCVEWKQVFLVWEA